MMPRLNPFKTAPGIVKAMMAVETAIAATGLDQGLAELVRVRSSQINGCSACIYMHTSDARARGESEMRLYMLDAWRESSLYSDKERAALAWAESLTLISETGAPDNDYELLSAHFTEDERVTLTFVIGAINLWNRLQIASRAVHPAPSDSTRAPAFQSPQTGS